MRAPTPAFVLLALLGCGVEEPTPSPASGGDEVAAGGRPARSGGAPARGGSVAGAAGGEPSGGAASGGTAAGGDGGSAEIPDARLEPADAAVLPDAPVAEHDAGAPAPTASGQGPVAEGKIVYANDFEANLDGFVPSPPTLPASRYTLVADPLGQRGKVLQVVWMAGDTFKTSPNNKPRSCVSLTGYEPHPGTHVNYAWGYMTTSLDINATFAQNIRDGGPIWMLEGHEQGDLIVRRGGGGGSTSLNYKLEPNRWYDFRVDLDYATGAAGAMAVYINGQKVFEKSGLGLGDPPTKSLRWDGGIYNTQIGIANNRTRTVYISNLSVGLL